MYTYISVKFEAANSNNSNYTHKCKKNSCQMLNMYDIPSCLDVYFSFL